MAQASGAVRIGLIVKTHGVRGEVLVKPLTDDASRFDVLTQATVEDQGGQVEDVYEIEYARRHKDRLLLKFKGCSSANEAVRLKGRYITISEEELVTLPADSYFVFDILGCEVVGLSGEVFGSVTDVLQTGGNDVYVVAPVGEEGSEILIPAVKSVVKDVSINIKRIVVDLSGYADERY